MSAHTIYLNELRAAHIRGRVHRVEQLATHGWAGEIEAPAVSASVIYVKELDAHSVDTQAIYVHKLTIKKAKKGKDDDD